MDKINKSLLWDITYDCNLRCKHCYNATKTKESKGKTLLDIHSLDYIFNRIQKIGVNHIHMLGGEPFCSDKLFNVLECCKNHNIFVSINTNGTYLNDSFINLLYRTNINQITISLDGVVSKENDLIRGKGNFELTCQGIKRLSKYIKEYNQNTVVQVATVITKINADNIHKMPAFIKELGVDHLNILKLYECGNAKNNSDILSLSNTEYVKVLKKILINSCFNKVYTQIDCKPKVISEINRSLGFSIETSSKFNSCQAGESILYMDVYGNIFPCGPCSQYDNVSGLFKCNLSDEYYLYKIGMYRDIIERMITKHKYRSNLCSECEFEIYCSSCALCDTSSDLCELTVNEYL